MISENEIRSAVRLELGDLPESFREQFRGTGVQKIWDLPNRNIDPDSLILFRINGDRSTTDIPASDYTLNATEGILTFDEPPEEDSEIVVIGTAHGIFSDSELDVFIDAAVSQHLNARTTQRRYRDGHGFIKYDIVPMTLENIPSNEKILLALLTTIEALWALTTDASTDIDVQTAEGTSIPRSQRYRQITAQIDLLTDKYKELSLAMGVGLFAPEVMDLRRVSRTTGRLVPIFEPREYDEHGPPVRKLPPRTRRNTDPDGPENPYWSGGWGF